MTLDANLVTRWMAITVLALATGTMFVISLRGNYLYGYGIGQSDEKRALFAWANVAADVWKAFGLVAISALWRNRHWRIALVGSIAWFVCLLSGINSAIGVYVQDRAALTGLREAKHASYRDVERDLAHVEAKLATLGRHRSTGELDALIAAALARAVISNDRVRGTVGKLSSDCKAPDVRTAEVCAEIARLRSERAAAEEAAELKARVDTLRADIATLRDRGNALPPDPVGEFYAWATRGMLSVHDVGFGFPLFFALLIEIVTAFGPITVVRFAELSVTSASTSDTARTWRVMSRHVEVRPVAGPLAERVDDRVAAWMSERARPRTGGGAISLQELHENYQSWCAAQRLPHCDVTTFAAAFDRLGEMPELSGKIRKFDTRYYGICVLAGGAGA